MRPMECISSHTFNDGRAMIDLWKGAKYYTANIWIDDRTSRRIIKKSVRGENKEDVLLKAVAKLKKMLGKPLILVETENWGEPLPFKIRTEEEEIKDWAEGFIEKQGIGKVLHPSVFLTREYGPKYEYKQLDRETDGN